MANGPFILTEQQVALRLGVPSSWVAQRRGPKGDRWDRGDGGRYLWSEAAAEALAGDLEPEAAKIAQEASDEKTAVVTLPSAETSPSAAQRMAIAEKSAPADPLAKLRVIRTGWKNRRVLHAVVVEGEIGGVVTVWVQNSARFAIGLEILGRPWPGRPGVFTFAGNPERPEAGPREPRRKGGW